MTRFMSIIFLWPLFATEVISAYTPCQLCVDRASATELEKIIVRLYTGPTVNDYTSFPVGDSLSLSRAMNKNIPTIGYIFGWQGTPELSYSQDIVSAYLARRGYNILLLDWQNISRKPYSYAFRSVEGVGYILAILLNNLVALGLRLSGIHIVGHSLGAQISGYTGRYVNFTLPRITGLDPAGPGFSSPAKHLSFTDAGFVDIMHTDRGVFGIDQQTGHVDFYPNNGVRTQPGCPVGPYNCSHYRSCVYYAESVQNENAFIGRSCGSNSNLQRGSCSSNPTAVMGYGTPTNTRGRFYLTTNNASPYGREENGSR